MLTNGPCNWPGPIIGLLLSKNDDIDLDDSLRSVVQAVLVMLDISLIKIKLASADLISMTNIFQSFLRDKWL